MSDHPAASGTMARRMKINRCVGKGDRLTVKATHECGCMGWVPTSWVPFLLGHVIEAVTDPTADGFLTGR